MLWVKRDEHVWRLRKVFRELREGASMAAWESRGAPGAGLGRGLKAPGQTRREAGGQWSPVGPLPVSLWDSGGERWRVDLDE